VDPDRRLRHVLFAVLRCLGVAVGLERLADGVRGLEADPVRALWFVSYMFNVLAMFVKRL
jgi:hypothetical protein